MLRSGATATTINSLYTPGEITNQLTDAGATWLFTISPMLPQAEAAAEASGIPADHLIVLDGAEGHPSLRDLLGEGRPAPDVTFDPATHVAVLPYSSGTTGHPKGVKLSHRNLIANIAQSSGSIGLGERGLGAGDRVLAVLPFFHIYGMTVLLNFALRERATLVTMPKFDLPEFLRIVSETKVTWIFIAPPIAVALAKHPLVDQFDLSSVEVVFSGRRAARRLARRSRRPAPRLHRLPGLRHDRAQPGLALHPGRAPRHRPLEHRHPAAQHRGPHRRRRERRRRRRAGRRPERRRASSSCADRRSCSATSTTTTPRVAPSTTTAGCTPATSPP